MRHDPAPAEQKLWHCLRAKRLDGLKFRRQHPIGPYIADFYCHECRLVVEADGESHCARQDADERRTEWLNARDYRVARFTNPEIHDNLEGVLIEILRLCGK